MTLIQEHPIVLGTPNNDDSQPENTLHTFELFPKFPQEIRLKIWKMSCLPRWITIKTASEIPPLDPRSSGGLMLVNFEARQVFQENHTQYFDKWGQRGRFLNLERDTLCFDKKLLGLEEMATEYPSIINKLQWMNIGTQKCKPGPIGIVPFEYWQMLPSLELITFRQYLGTPEAWKEGGLHWWRTSNLLDPLRIYQFNLLKENLPGMPYEGPRLACIWSLSGEPDEELYFESTQDLKRASYGRLLGTSYNLPQSIQVNG